MHNICVSILLYTVNKTIVTLAASSVAKISIPNMTSWARVACIGMLLSE